MTEQAKLVYAVTGKIRNIVKDIRILGSQIPDKSKCIGISMRKRDLIEVIPTVKIDLIFPV